MSEADPPSKRIGDTRYGSLIAGMVDSPFLHAHAAESQTSAPHARQVPTAEHPPCWGIDGMEIDVDLSAPHFIKPAPPPKAANDQNSSCMARVRHPIENIVKENGADTVKKGSESGSADTRLEALLCFQLVSRRTEWQARASRPTRADYVAMSTRGPRREAYLPRLKIGRCVFPRGSETDTPHMHALVGLDWTAESRSTDLMRPSHATGMHKPGEMVTRNTAIAGEKAKPGQTAPRGSRPGQPGAKMEDYSGDG